MTAAVPHSRQPDQAPAYLASLEHTVDVVDVGGKAFNLGRMLRLDVSVPPGVIVTRDAFDAFIAENDLRDWVDARCAGLDVNTPDFIRDVSESIRDKVRQSRLPQGLAEKLAASCRPLLDQGPLIVRSSGVGEDSENASFAGQLDSFGNIARLEDVESALLDCWASYWSERSLFYQLSRGVRLQGMGVVIQQQIGSVFSGVLFTRSPVDQDDEMLLEYCIGPGENLNSGLVTPTSLHVPRSSDASWQPSAPAELIGSAAERGTDLHADTVQELVQIGLRLESAFGRPQDIEWTVDASRQLHVVQSRPITAGTDLSCTADGGGSAGRAAEKVVWSNANINENFPEPVSSFLYSIASLGYYQYFRNLALAFGISKNRIGRMDAFLRNIVGLQAGRLYYNLTNIHAALRMAPYGDALASSFNDFVGTDIDTASPRYASTWDTDARDPIARWAEAAAILVHISWLYLGLPGRVAEFEKTVADFSRRTHPDDLGKRSLTELREHLDEFVDIRCNRWLGASLADTSAMVCHGLLKQLLDRESSHLEKASLHNTLLKGLPNLASAEPAHQLWQVSRQIRSNPGLLELFQTQSGVQVWDTVSSSPEYDGFRSAVNAFLEEWGFRFSGELMLTVPSYQENPGGLMELLKTYATLVGDSPAEVMRQQATARERQTARVLDGFRRRRPLRYVPGWLQACVFRRILTWTQQSIMLRERARLKQALLYSRCRRILLAIGERLVDAGHLASGENVFWLTYEELADVIGHGQPDLRGRESVAERRRIRAEQWRLIDPPDTFELGEGEHYREPRGCPDDPPDGARLATDVELHGVGACGGVVTATAQPVRGLEQAHLLSPGDVLVTRQTDPGWGPLFFIAGGLVLERGGMLSHGAILAREYGLPCVVAVEGALDRIPAGQTVTVDGDREVVRIVR